jgi:hypothetical protein
LESSSPKNLIWRSPEMIFGTDHTDTIGYD